MVELVLKSGSLSLQDSNGEFADALMLVLGSHKALKRGAPICLGLSFSKQLFDIFFSTGISPNESLPGFGRPLSRAVAEDLAWSVSLLISHGADINYTDTNTLCPLAQAMVSFPHNFLAGHFLEDDIISLVDDSLVTELSILGANMDQPSCTPEGFTPLMFATGDRVPSLVFDILIEFGATRENTGRLHPGGPKLSVLQCLLSGFPPAQDAAFCAKHELRSLRYSFNYAIEDPKYLKAVEKCRKSKFESLIQPPLDPATFHTEDGVHVLHWAIENLQGWDLAWAMDMLIPQYASTETSLDTKSPFLTFFHPDRVRNSMAFGTLFQTCRFVEGIVELGFQPEDSLLLRICKLRGGLSSPAVWGLMGLRTRNNLDFSPQFLGIVQKENPRFTNKYRAHPSLLQFRDLTRSEKAYREHRTKTISKIITLLIKNGANFYACDSDGKTAYEHAKIHNTLNGIPKKWRDVRKELEIDQANP